jgi:hypothetical protein
VQEYETTSAIEATRCRRAQYTGRIATVVLAGSTVTGMLRSIAEDNSCSSKRWVATIDQRVCPRVSAQQKNYAHQAGSLLKTSAGRWCVASGGLNQRLVRMNARAELAGRA